MPDYLLDTGLLIRHLRGQKSAVRQLRGLGRVGRLAIATVTRLEIRAGTADDERYVTEKLLSRFVTYTLDPDVADRAGDLVRASHGRGAQLGVPDAVIAATAILRGLTLVTYNKDHFEHIPGLSVEPLQEL
jgi:predicted nucleic acid-binding protein